MVVMQHVRALRARTPPVGVGIDVARFPVTFERTNDPAPLRSVLQGGDFDHAVDNSGDSFGLVADWPALKCWRQPYPPAARGSRGCFDYQPRHRAASGLSFKDCFQRKGAKTQRKRDCLLCDFAP